MLSEFNFTQLNYYLFNLLKLVVRSTFKHGAGRSGRNNHIN